jgi:hypothetical protein
MTIKFSKQKPLIHKSLKDYHEQKQIQELLEEFEYLMYCERLKQHYSTHKPPKK